MPTTPPPLTIRLFGEPQILRGGAPVEVPRRKSRALAFYLAAHEGSVPRSRLLTLFWPDHERAAAQQSLRTTIHGLRRALGATLVATDAGLAVAGAAVDARALAAALAAPADESALAAALAEYRGDFLADLSLPENPELDDWITAERERYRRLVTRGLVALARARADRGDHTAALEDLRRALALDPLQEAIQREAMLAEYRTGDRAAAIRRYEQLRDRLDDELGVPPMAETRALYDAIVTDSLPAEPPRPREAPRRATPPAAVAPPAPDELPFVGREAELAQLRAAQDSQRLVLVEGEPGIGKSELVARFIAESGALGLSGTAHELEQSIPYHPLIEALRGLTSAPEWPALAARVELAPLWRAEVARLVPELGPGSAPLAAADESRVWEAVSQLLHGIAQVRPTILFLDDLQWADLATIGLVAYLARRSANTPLTIIVAARPAEPRSALATLLQTLTREGRLARMPLDRLGPQAVGRLASAVSTTYAAPLAEWLMQNAEGNPYITVELIRYAHERNLIGPNGTLVPGAVSAGPVVPHTVEALIQSRLARLSEPARLLLDAGVAAGREFAFDVVASASALSEAAVLDGLDELRAARLVEALPDGRYRFDHSLTMEVAYRDVGEPRHRRLHRRLAEALEELGYAGSDELAATLAWHYAEAGAPQRAAPFALRAARRAAGLAAWQEAIAHYRQALAGTTPDRLQVLMELGEALQHLGDTAATEVYQEAIALAQSAGSQAAVDAARLALGATLLQRARFAELIALVEQVRSGGHPGSALRAELTWGIALSVEGADLEGASRHLRIAEALSDAATDAATRSTIFFELGSVRAQQGELGAAVELYYEALDIATRDPAALQQRVLAHNNLAYHLLLLGEPSAEEHAREGLRLAQESGTVAFQAYLRSTLGEIALARGDLDDAEREFGEGLLIAERVGMPERIAGLTANLGLAAIRRGQTALAVHRLSSALARADALGLPHLAAQIRIWLAPLLPPGEARATLAAARAIAEGSGRRRLLAEVERLEQTLAP